MKEANPKLERDFRRTVIASFRPPDLDLKVATFDPAELTEPLHESRQPGATNRRSSGPQESESSHSVRLLRPRCDRPRRRAAEQRDDLAPLQSITSSAIESSDGGTIRRASWQSRN
jgi:hypothetical protein